MDILDYIKWRNDVPFSISPFNDVDNAILSELSYIDLDEFLQDNEFITLSELEDRYFEKYDYNDIYENATSTLRAPLLLKGMKNGDRFKNIMAGYFINEVEKEKDKQFSATVYVIDDTLSYVAFRGTDCSIIGWKEDFILSYSTETEGSKSAVKYLNEVSGKLKGDLIVGGHSKGGNFAVYASVFCDENVKERIIKIYTNDGPGFHEETINMKEYREMVPKMKSILPNSSIIGMLLSNDCVSQVINSNANGIYQHDILSWQVEKDGFEKAELSKLGRFVKSALGSWLEKIDEETRESVIETVFSLIEASGSQTFREFGNQKWKSAEVVLSGLYRLPKEKQKELLGAVGDLIQSSGSVVISNTTKKIADIRQ